MASEPQVNVVARYQAMMFAVLPGGIIAFGALSLLLSQWFLIPLVGFLIVVLGKVRSLSCPRCGTRLGWGGWRDATLRETLSKPNPTIQCEVCHLDLTGRTKKE